MARATKIKMNSGSYGSNNLLEIDLIWLEDVKVPAFYKKSLVHDFIKKGHTVYVGNTYTKCAAKVSTNGEKYVASSPNNTTSDNLLSLPRE